MAISCSSCNDLRENAAEFVQNGVTDTVCTSLKNDTGFNPSNDRNDCTDLNDANDCLIGNAADELEAYDVCDWKEFMKNFLPNLYNVLKAIICAICGLWTNIHTILCKLNAVIDALSDTAMFVPTQKYMRNSNALTTAFWMKANQDETILLDDAHSGDSENQDDFYAPSDGVAIVSFCFALEENNNLDRVGYYIYGMDSAESPSQEMRKLRACHFSTLARQGAWGYSTAVKMKKGHYLKLRVLPAYDNNPSTANVRLHQICVTFIPTFELDYSSRIEGNC